MGLHDFVTKYWYVLCAPPSNYILIPPMQSCYLLPPLSLFFLFGWSCSGIVTANDCDTF